MALAKLLDLQAGGKGLFQPQGEYGTRQPCETVVLAPGEIPTTDLYLRGRLETRFGEAVRYVDTLRTTPQEFALGDHTMIVIVRHTPLFWLRWLEEQRHRLVGVAFLMDDDIPAAILAPELPFRYALKTAWRYARAKHLLGRLCSEVWVSTPELAKRYAGSSPTLWEPGYVVPASTEEETTVYFYHGTWSHRREMEWLVPVVRQVQEAVPGAWFEIMGTDRVRRLFRGIPRVRIVHPMPWKDYLASAGAARYQVGLAPCFDTDFNQARSHSKIFDITRLGAAGIYSDLPPYAENVIHERTGMLCENVSEAWVTAITRLLQDDKLRRSLYQQSLEWCNRLSLQSRTTVKSGLHKGDEQKSTSSDNRDSR